MTQTPVFLCIGKGETEQKLRLDRANRHGLIAGATGTGKTVTLQILAEGFSQAGVPVFAADVKGDLSGISQAGKDNPKMIERAAETGPENYTFQGYPTVFWDLFGKKGHPIRTTVSEMGPLLLSQLLELNDTQEGVLNIAFTIADDEGMLLLDLKDLRAMLNFVGQHSSSISTKYGNVSKSSVGAIQRRLLVLENEGAKKFFGEPALELSDFMRCDDTGKGNINILSAQTLMQNPKLYSTFLLWLLSELFEELPEVGDPDKPKLVFFFDEAHLLFQDAPKSLIKKVEQVVRLIRSKGVGVYFVTQNPIDIPDSILGQLGNRVQHALRAFTPKDQKAVKAAAQTFRSNPKLDVKEVITQLGVGKALVSVLDEKGAPTIVEKTKIRPPESRMGPAIASERKQVISESPVLDKYDVRIDRKSAFELLSARAEQNVAKEKALEKERKYKKPATKKRRSSSSRSTTNTVIRSVTKIVTSRVGQQLVRGILGSFFKGR
ncbi:MAG: helicase HerA-like domain-containing protein [Gammaproteobacteria bacterium]|nr:helicase HerA-like domain-containing protein [Gammaproteobacteria bacterium]